jgi:CRISPR-associated endonuclease/helicase Cas3
MSQQSGQTEPFVLSVAGKRSDGCSRRGQLVIATQVAEQSLVDALASDLAPVDALIQRLGRWRRHKRLADGTLRVDKGPDLRSPDDVVLLSPALDVRDKNWLARVLPRAVKIYPDHARLWLTARLLQTPAQIVGRPANATDSLRLPGDLKALIESVYDTDEQISLVVPALLHESLTAQRGVLLEEAIQAGRRALRFRDGLLADWTGDLALPELDESVPATRLGESHTVVLATVGSEGTPL